MGGAVEAFDLEHVEFIPSELSDGIVYFSKTYSIAAHLCACGCRSSVYTPVKDGEWSLEENCGRPTLEPSIGNWTLRCRSHYFIRSGQVKWAKSWSEDMVASGRAAEERRRRMVYHIPWWKRAWRWIASRFN